MKLRQIARAAVVAAALAVPTVPAHAQPSPALVAAPDPARLAAARILIDQIIPVDRREEMVEEASRPMLDMMRSAIAGSPMFSTATTGDPNVAKMVDQFLKEEFERSLAESKASMPVMLEAMARAYARRFTLDELKAISAFFATPAGRSYADQSVKIMSDPDIQAEQRAMMDKHLAGMKERIAALGARLAPDQPHCARAPRCGK